MKSSKTRIRGTVLGLSGNVGEKHRGTSCKHWDEFSRTDCLLLDLYTTFAFFVSQHKNYTFVRYGLDYSHAQRDIQIVHTCDTCRIVVIGFSGYDRFEIQISYTRLARISL